MKGKRLATAGLALALSLSLAAAPASAATFPDIENHWAASYIEEMTQLGLFTGYEDGTFKPDRALTAAEAITLCARVATQAYGLDRYTIADMQMEWQQELNVALGSTLSWFYDEAAIALEVGILSWDDLSQRAQAGAFNAPLQKELFSVYLVRAMGLEDLAQSLSTYTLYFADTDSITKNYQPYVYLLSSYGVLTGDENNNFNPASAINRAISSTMLSRVLDYIDSVGLSPELPEYTDYDWQVGDIMTVTSGSNGSTIVSLSNELSGDKRITIPASAYIYKNDREAKSSEIKTGYYAKICYVNGNISAVRLYDASDFATVTGTIEDISDQSITVESDGTSSTFELDRFTEVLAGGTAGDRDLIRSEDDYTKATVRYNEVGTAVSIQLFGGSSLQEGLLTDVTSRSSGGYTIQVTGFDGVAQEFTVGSNSTIMIDGDSGALRTSYEGSHVSMRVSNEDPNQCESLEVDTKSAYVQGSIRSISSTRTPGSVTVRTLNNTRTTTYTVPSSAEIYYEGKTAQLRDLDSNDFITLRYTSGNEVEFISAWPGSTETSGELTAITYGSTTTLTVTRDDGTEVQFPLDMTDLPTIERDGKESTLARLALGDYVVITLRYQEVSHIDATPQNANAEGVIESVTHATDSSTLTIRLTDGEVETYTLSNSATITQDDQLVARTALQPGYKLSMVVSGDTILSVNVENSTSANRLGGTVLLVDTGAMEILFQVDSGSAITVNVSSSTTFTDAATGGTTTMRYLEVGDYLTIYGGYSGGEFNATLIIVE